MNEMIMREQFLSNTVDATIKILSASFSSSSTPRLDAQVLLSHILQKPKAWLLAHNETCLTTIQHRALNTLAAQVKKGIPLPYVIGHWEFFGLDFLVTPSVLIPRPETELLVEFAFRWLMDHPDRRRAIDIGTGTGCIAIALASSIPDLNITAIDISPAALDVARANAAKHQIESRINFVQADLLPSDSDSTGSIKTPFDIITANLPYIPTSTLTKLDVVKHEPTLALDGGKDGLDLIRRFLRSAVPYLSPSGCILLEIDAKQGHSGIKLAKENFPSSNISIHPDLSGKDRLLMIKT